MLTIEQPQLSAAQKAWQTRRLAAAVRADVVALKTGIAEPTPIGDAAVVEINMIDVPKVGSGFRRYLVTSIGAKSVELFYAPLLQRVVIDRLTFDRRAKPQAFRKRKLAEIIRANIVERTHCFPEDCAQQVAWAEQALAILNAVRGGKRASADLREAA